MGKRLVIAEKPMLAKAILDAIPGTAKSIKAGERVFYTEKGDYLVVALVLCVQHICRCGFQGAFCHKNKAA